MSWICQTTSVAKTQDKRRDLAIFHQLLLNHINIVMESIKTARQPPGHPFYFTPFFSAPFPSTQLCLLCHLSRLCFLEAPKEKTDGRSFQNGNQLMPRLRSEGAEKEGAVRRLPQVHDHHPVLGVHLHPKKKQEKTNADSSAGGGGGVRIFCTPLHTTQ